MLNANKNTNSSSTIVITHFLTSAIIFFLITVLLSLSSQAFIGHYFQPKILAITHLTTLGWVTLIIFGALYQLIPVIAGKELYSVKFSLITFICFVTGTLLLAFSFWYFIVGFLLQLAAILLFVGASLFVINIFLTIQKSMNDNIETDFILSAVYWLWLTVFIGMLLAFNLTHAFLPKDHLHYLKIHAHVGILGWLLLLIIGVSSKLIPMFLLSGKLDTKKMSFAYYFLHAGLVGFLVDSFFFNGISRVLIYLLLVIIGIAFYIAYLVQAYKKRVRKKLDIGLKHSFISFIFIAIPLTLIVLLNSNIIQDPKLSLQISIAFGFSVFFGFITLLILGQTFKTLPFIAWHKKYEKFSGKIKTPLPKDLYSEKLAYWQLIVFTIGYMTTITGILLSKVFIIQAGSCILVCAAIIYNINVFKVVLHKPQALNIK